MTFMEKVEAAWERNNSLVCVGLDPDLDKLPDCVKHRPHPIFEFNRAIIDATADLVCAYKPQAAYYAGQDADEQLQMTIDHIRHKHPDIPVILDVKRGDIGSTAEMYAKEAFDRYQADAVTVNPYLGLDSLQPFLERRERGIIVLCRTSNPSSSEIQGLVCGENTVFEHVAMLARDKWNVNGNILLVIGATFPDELARIRRLCPDMPFLVPGVGAQGGDVKRVVENGATADGTGLIINSSRGIIYAGGSERFAAAAAAAADELRHAINLHRHRIG